MPPCPFSTLALSLYFISRLWTNVDPLWINPRSMFSECLLCTNLIPPPTLYSPLLLPERRLIFVVVVVLCSERQTEEEQEAERAEREALLSAIEEHKRLEAENEERIKNRNVSFQRDLDMQIDYQQRVKAKELEEEEREFRMGQVS